LRDAWPIIVCIYTAMSLITFAGFDWDKLRARGGGRRVPESMLHLLELLGGWPGAIVGSRIFRQSASRGGTCSCCG
jgi:uncharacterized membrane protein YsdA (DUF1294 family)